MNGRRGSVVGKPPFRRVYLSLFLFLLSLYLLTSAGYPTTSMGASAFMTAKHLVEKGTFALDNPSLETGVGKDGRYYVYEGLAFIMACAVFVAISKIVGVFPHLLFLMNPLLTAFSCLLIFRIGRELYYSQRTSVGLAIIYGVGTMAWVHSRFLMPEPLTTAVYLSAFLFLLRYKNEQRARWLFLCGAFTGLALIVRPDAPLFLLAIVIGLGIVLWKKYREEQQSLNMVAREVILFILPVALFFVVYAYYNYARFGHILELGYSTKAQVEAPEGAVTGRYRFKGIELTLWGFAGMWLIPCRSMFLINPVLIFIFWALKDFWKKFRMESIVIGIALALHVMLYANRGPTGFPGSSAWGVRYMVPMTAFMVIVMGMFVERVLHRPRTTLLFKLFVVLFVLSSVFQFIGSSVTYQATQGYLMEHYNTPEEPWIARWKMNLDPRWNLITQNTKWFLRGKTDFLYLNSLDPGKTTVSNYLWGGEVPGWVGYSFVIFLGFFLYSGYVVFRFLVLSEPVPLQAGFERKKKR